MLKNNKSGLAWIAAWVVGTAAAQPAAPSLRLHVPSPDWRDQVIYFVVTDRFADGDAANNDQGAGEYRPGDATRHQGGDLRGLLQRLDYVQGLGATALWITPPVANQWLAPDGSSSGYHGYWAENLLQVDRHLGSLDDYRGLSDGLHRRGMFLVQDIVVNHMGNFFGYDGWRAANPARGWRGHTATAPVARPSQPPFDRNDPRDGAQRASAVYHWTPDVSDYTRRDQELRFQMSGLDDLNTENPAVRRALRASYGHWIRAAGVDAFRVDTAFYVPPAFFADFLHAADPAAPGIARVARATGRDAFFTFGEGFGIDRPGRTTQSRKMEGYVRGSAGAPLLDGMLNFPLYGALGDVFARGRPAAELGDRITRMRVVHRDIHRMPSFVDNHDVDRFLASGSAAALRQALLALFTLPGIPVIYYGTEQGFTEPRAAMFAAGAGSGGRDRYDAEAPLYRLIAGLATLRRGHERLFSRGLPRVLAANAARSGALAWRTTHGGHDALVVFNTSDTPTLAAQIATGFAPGTRLDGVFGLDGTPAAVVVGAAGRLTLELPARAGWVFRPAAVETAATAVAPTIAAVPLRAGGDFDVRGSAPPGAELRLVIDGDIAGAQRLHADAAGRWRARVDTGAMVDGGVEHTLVAWAGGGAASAPRPFRVQRAWRQRAWHADPAGDDHGPDGGYRYPTAGAWRELRPMDLRGVYVFEAGGALKIELQMARISTRWNPAHGFDHVAFTIFVELPGTPGGSELMPLQDARLPGGMRWHRRLRAHGWSNALFTADGAAAGHEGTPTGPAAAIAVNRSRSTVTFTLPAAALAHGGDLRGARLFVSTWDWDGGMRALGAEAQPYALGGGTPGAPKLMDDSGVIVLR